MFALFIGVKYYLTVAQFKEDLAYTVSFELTGYRDGYLWVLVDDEIYLGKSLWTNRNIVISDEIEGYPVAILYGGLFQEKKITSITWVSTLEIIGKQAFMGVSGLTSLTIPGYITTVKDEAFLDCDDLTELTIRCLKTSKKDGPF